MRPFIWLCPLALALLVGSCGEVETRTQLTFTLSASPAIREQIEVLSVVVRSDERGDQPREFLKNELKWPVEIVVLPAAGNDSTYEVTLFVQARGAQSQVLAAQSVSGRFTPEKRRIVPLSLGTENTPGPDQPGIDAGQTDAGPVEPSRDAGPPTQTDAQGPAPGVQDAGPGVINCMTNPGTVKCDDNNPCNGTEQCAPGNGSANSNGCVPGSDVIACLPGTTCDRNTSMCSACLAKPDGDNDGVNSRACMGMDCDDSDDTIAPGKLELCDGKDNDCDGTIDGPQANATCAMTAPTGGTSSCVSGRCAPACNMAAHQIENGACVPPPVSCPIANPCAPGTCAGAPGTYTCTCPSGFRAGIVMTRCAPLGVPNRSLGFETTCDGMPTPGAFVAEYKPLAPNLYAGCGVSAIASGALMSPPQLIEPMTTVIAGITGGVALASPVAAGPVDLTISFLPGVNELKFNVLDLDNPAGLSVVVRAGGNDLPAQMPMPAAGSKQIAFSQLSALPIERVTLTYTPLPDTTDSFYVDQLSFRVAGCGDRVVETDETCDDGNDNQCDGCDNACAASPTVCPGG